MTKSIENLQTALLKEQTAIQQYLLHNPCVGRLGLGQKLVFQSRVGSEL